MFTAVGRRCMKWAKRFVFNFWFDELPIIYIIKAAKCSEKHDAVRQEVCWCSPLHIFSEDAFALVAQSP